MAKARVLVLLLIFIASETLVLGDSIAAKVSVSDELTNDKESDKQKPTLSNGRIGIPPNRGVFRIIKSVSSSVSSKVSRPDGDSSDKKRKNAENVTGSVDEDSEGFKDERRIPEELLHGPSSHVFNFDDFLTSVNSKNYFETDIIENVPSERPFSHREPVKPMPTKIALAKLGTKVAEPILVSIGQNEDHNIIKETPIINPSNFTINQSESVVDLIRSETTQVKRRRPVVMRKSRRISTPQTSQPKSEQLLEVEKQGVNDSSVKTSRSSSKSRRPTILPEKTRRRLFPSRRNLTRSLARKRLKGHENGIQTHSNNNVNLLTESVPVITTMTTSTTTTPTSIISESQIGEIVDTDYLTYGELYEPAPPEPRYTPTPKVVNNVLVRKANPKQVLITRPHKAKLTNNIRNSHSNSNQTDPASEYLFLDGEAVQLANSLQDNSVNKASEIVTSEVSANKIQENEESIVVQHGPFLFKGDSKGTEAIPRRDIAALPDQFDYTNYEDLVEFYDYPEDYNDNPGAHIYDNFQYGYKVAEKTTGNYHARSENRDGKKVSGTYEVALPDGRIQLVNYVADNDGFRAEVTYKKENKTSSSELSKVASARNNVKELKKQKVTSRFGRNRVKLNNPNSLNDIRTPSSQLKQSPVNSFDNSVLKEIPTFNSRNSHMTPHPALHKSNSGQQRSRDKFNNRGNSIVNSHFDSKQNVNSPVSFNTKDEVSDILKNHGLLRPIIDTRRGPIPKPIPPHGHREVAKIPPNPFNKKSKKKSHVPVKPQPKLVSTIAPTEPPKSPVHPLLEPGAFNRPVLIDRKPERDFSVTASPLQFPPVQFPPQQTPVQFPPQHSPLQFPPLQFPLPHSPVQFPPQQTPFAFPGNSLELERNRLPESHFESHNPFPNPFFRRTPIEQPVFHNTPLSTSKQLRVNQQKKGKINFSVDSPVTTPSPNPFKVVVERIRPSTYSPFRTHFVTPRNFPLSHEQTPEDFLHQPSYSDGDLRDLSHIELLKTPVNEPIYYEHTGVYSSADYPAENEELIHRSISHRQFTIPENINPVTTQRPFFTFSHEKFPSVSNERTLAITPKSIFSQDSFGQQFTTVAPIRKSKFLTTSVPYNRVTSIIPFRSMTPVTPPAVRFPFAPTQAPIPTTTTRSSPLFFKYPSKNGTPTPTLVYHPDNPIFIHALGQTHAIPLLLPYEGSASEKSETKAKKTDRQVAGILPSKEPKFQKSDIYPEPLPRFSIK